MFFLELDSSYEKELKRLIESKNDVFSQYLIFKNAFDELFGLNVLKSDEIIATKDLDILQKQTSGFSVAKTRVRDSVIDVVLFDRWLNRECAIEQYPLLIVCATVTKRFGILVKDIVGIVEIDKEDFIVAQSDDYKIIYAVEMLVSGAKKPCYFFDIDKLSYDLETHRTHKASDKLIAIAEDSKFTQEIIADSLKKESLSYLIFDNGKELMDFLRQSALPMLIITDLEMPIKDGFTVVKECKNDERLKHIDIIVYSSLTEDIVYKEIDPKHVKNLVIKPDINELVRAIKKLM